jgi:protoporphyrinogen oxidase
VNNGLVLVGGAGPAGLAAARFLAERGVDVVICEQGTRVGGLARTEIFRGFRLDIGGHRFLTSVPEIQSLWEGTLGDDFIGVARQSRIFYRGRFLDYPVSLANAARNLGVWEGARIAASYARARFRRAPRDDTFEQWIVNRFGDRLYRTFFKGYTEKVWGMPCTEIGTDWAAQRIRGLSLRAALGDLLGGRTAAPSLARRFHYPRLGSGQMWERFAERIAAAGGRLCLGTTVTTLRHDGRTITTAETDNGRVETLAVGQVISSLPIGVLVESLDPPPPAAVVHAARQLRHRDFILVGLILDRPQLFPDHWLYIHAPEVRVGRIQNFGNWSQAMVPDLEQTGLGMEYFCSVGDELWSQSDGDLIQLASRELHQLGLDGGARVEGGHVIRQPRAYPVYDRDYRTNLQAVRAWLAGLTNLQTIGRNGLHRYNNQDHSMLTGLLAARNLMGERHDVWAVNTDSTYLERQTPAALTGPRS